MKFTKTEMRRETRLPAAGSEQKNLTIICGDALEKLRELPDLSVQCCVTSPPYWGLRDYKVVGQIGQEKTPEEYVAKLVTVFQEVWRVLKDDGTLWLNLGDSYVAGGGGCDSGSTLKGTRNNQQESRKAVTRQFYKGLKLKNLIGTPWMVAFALRANGWYLRSDIIWHKKSCMPESVTDRPTRAHEYIFLLTKSPRYFYDADAIKEPCIYDADAIKEPCIYDADAIKEPCIYDVNGTGTAARKARADGNKLKPTGTIAGIRPAGYKNSVNFEGKNSGKEKQRGHSRRDAGFNSRWDAMPREQQCIGMRNKRDVWTVSPAQYSEAHFAVFPPDLIKPCILAGSRGGDTVLDPFGGSGTTGRVALELGRKAILIELNPDYINLIKQSTRITPGFAFK